MSGPVIFHTPPNRLKELVTKPGGKSRSEAISNATEELASVRGMAEEGLQEALTSIDQVVSDAGSSPLSDAQLDTVIENAERLCAVATAFNMTTLRTVSSSLGTLAAAMADADAQPSGPVAVHARAARWCVENPDVPGAAVERMLAGLDKVKARFGGQAS